MTVVLSYIKDFKTLKIHDSSYAKGKEYPSIDCVLKSEASFECIELLQMSQYTDSRIPAALEVFNRCCPTLSKLVIDLGYFTGWSPGWDRELREATASRRSLPVRQVPGPLVRGNFIVSRLGEFPNLRHLVAHFMNETAQIALMHPSQGLQAVREMYQEIEKHKQGLRLEQLDVVFNTWQGNVYGCVYRYCNDSKIAVTMTCRYVGVENRKTREDFALTCDNERYGKMIERRKTAEKLYGDRAWQHHLGPYFWERSQGRKWRPKGLVIDLITQVALLPSVVMTNEMRRAGRRRIFHV